MTSVIYFLLTNDLILCYPLHLFQMTSLPHCIKTISAGEFKMDSSPDLQPSTRKRHILFEDVQKMLKEAKLEYHRDIVVNNLCSFAEHLAIKTLEDVVYYKVYPIVYDSDSDEEMDEVTLTKDDISFVSSMHDNNLAKVPNEDTKIQQAVELNGNPLYVREIDGVRIPTKGVLDNKNYRMENAFRKRARLYTEKVGAGTNIFQYYMPIENTRKVTRPTYNYTTGRFTNRPSTSGTRFKYKFR